MIQKLYPKDQIEKYLLIDVVTIAIFTYLVFVKYNTFGFFGSFVLYAMFLGAFYVNLWYRDWRLLFSSFVAFGVLTVLGIFYHHGLLTFAFLQADLLGRSRSKKMIGIGMLGILAMYMTTYYGREGHPFAFVYTAYLPVLIVMLLLPVIVYIRQQSLSLEHALDEAHDKLERYIQEEERNRIARDLHDTLGQTLTMIKMKSELAMRLMDKQQSELAKKEMKEVMDTSRFALKQVREMVTSMRYVSIAEEIRQAEELFQMAGIRLAIRGMNEVPSSLSRVAETMIALSLREALTNVIKHSQAKNCSVDMLERDGVYEVKVVDDGIGIGKGAEAGNGIESIRERMRLVQGSAVITESSDGGVTVTLSIPTGERGNVP